MTHRLSVMRKGIVTFLLLIVIFSLVYPVWLFQTQITDAQKQTLSLQNQLAEYENSTDTLQTRVSNLEAQLRDLQNQASPTYNVTITGVTSTPWVPLVCLSLEMGITIIIKNTGIRDVGGITVEFKPPSDNSCKISLTEPEQIGVLHVQESIVLTAQAFTIVGTSFAGKSFVIKVMLDETVLDEHTVPLPDYGKST